MKIYIFMSAVSLIASLVVGFTPSIAAAELIKHAGLRELVGQVGKYDALVYKFRSKYGYLPGDMPNATSVWGKDAHCPSDAGQPSTTGTCNGNGDGIINNIGEGSTEALQFWRQLALAGFIEGSYSGVNADAANMLSGKVGNNLPLAKQIDSAHSSYESWWDSLKFWKREKAREPRWSIGHMDGKNFFILGDLSADGSASQPVMYPAVAMNIDSKLDDGEPYTGRVRAFAGLDCTISENGKARYNYALQSNACALAIQASF